MTFSKEPAKRKRHVVNIWENLGVFCYGSSITNKRKGKKTRAKKGEKEKEKNVDRKNKAGYTAQDAPNRRLKITRDRRTDGPTDEPTDRRTDGPTDGQSEL